MKRRLVLVAVIVFIISFLAAFILQTNKASAPAWITKVVPRMADKPAPEQAGTVEPAQPFNKTQFSLSDPASIWVIANKQRKLQPSDYVPSDLVVPDIRMKSGITSDENRLRKDTASALESLNQAAKAADVTLTMESGYRSYAYQTALYGRYVREQGQSVADTQSARPGHSEHQTGLAVDLGSTTRPACNVEQCYKDTVEGKWLAANAHTHGFVIRYPEGKQMVTGYIYEPWHLRYVGVALATEVQKSGITTLEEFFGLPAAANY